MRSRLLWSNVWLGALTIASLPAITVAGQTAARAGAAPAASKWTPARTADGHPDLQGTWDFRTVTPLERPAELAGKEFLTAEEAAEYERRMVAARDADANRDKSTSRGIINGTQATADVALAYNDFWWDRGTRVVSSRRTSLIIDPPDGRIPPLTPEAIKRLAGMDVARERPAEGPEDRSVAERCILGFNSGPPMVPGGYNQNVQIIQAPGYVVIANEMVHSARIVPLDGRPHGSARQWVGTSRGRWEGDTLVVETKNFLRETALRGSSPAMHLIERFTRVAADTLLYEFTVTDPTTWTRPWTAQIPMTRTDELIYEYACHEANYGMTNLLKAARVVEKEGAARNSTISR
jgi:hypothetical protein